ALTAVTTLFIKSSRPRYAWLTLAPLVWLLVVTMTAGWQKIFSADLRIGFLAYASHLSTELAAGRIAAEKIASTEHVIFNNRLDAVVTAVFMGLVAIVVLDAMRVWWKTLAGRTGPEPIAAAEASL